MVGADLTPGMITRPLGAAEGISSALLVADVMRCHFPDGQFDVVFAAGLLPHLIDPLSGLLELARVTARPGKRPSSPHRTRCSGGSARGYPVRG